MGNCVDKINNYFGFFNKSKTDKDKRVFFIPVCSYRNLNKLLQYVNSEDDKLLMTNYYERLLDAPVYSSNFEYHTDTNSIVSYYDYQVHASSTSSLRRYLSLNGLNDRAQIGYIGEYYDLIQNIIGLVTKNKTHK